MIYSIVYNYTQPLNSDHLHQIVTTAIMVTDWWHYLPNMYLVNTTLNSSQITSTLQIQFPGMLFIVTRIDTSEYNGVLPRDAWDWIQKYNTTKKLIRIKKVTDTSYSMPLKIVNIKPLSSGQTPIGTIIKPNMHRTIESLLRNQTKK